jgi:N-acetylmuramoyl-L-alanine amidase
MMGLSIIEVLGYALKMACISFFLFGYYWLFLRNRPFHQWNRAYLLGIVVFSLVMPLVPLPGLFSFGGGEAPVLKGMLHAVVRGNWKEDEGGGDAATAILTPGGVDWSRWMFWAYSAAAFGSGFVFLRELGFIVRLYRRYPSERRGGVRFLQTQESGTPFSFLRIIFWNAELDMASAEGQQILRHELVHVRQRHTLDLLLLRPVMILFWFNPVFYFVYRELRTIHEFEADALASADCDRFSYAELLVWQTLSHRPGGLFHSFFSSSIKRRITMITQTSFVAPGRWSRWMAAPLAGVLLFAFSSRTERLPGSGGWGSGDFARSAVSGSGGVARSVGAGSRGFGSAGSGLDGGPRSAGSGSAGWGSAAASAGFARSKGSGPAVSGSDGFARSEGSGPKAFSAGGSARQITVVIDAGHGGWDAGAVASNGLKEKNVNLAIARKVKQLASSYGVNVVLTRDADELAGGMKSKQASLHYRADLAAAQKADLFISLHTDAKSGGGLPGVNIYVTKDNRYFEQSAKLGGVLIDALKPSYSVGNELQEVKEHVWVLRSATVPAVLIECGNIDDDRDRAFISDANNQEAIARDILQGIVNYKQ